MVSSAFNMRALTVLAALLTTCLAHAAPLTGTYVVDTQQGRIIAQVDVNGERFSGSIDFAGKAEVKLIGIARADTASGTASSKDGIGSFEAVVQGNILKLTISQKDGPNQKAATLPLQFQRTGSDAAVPVPPASGERVAGDPRLVGNWSHQDVIVSGDASFASEEKMALRADGTFSYGKGRSAAGGKDWSFDGGKDGVAEGGRWRAQDGILFVTDAGGEWTRVGKYGITDDGRTMRISYDRGNRKLWSRR